MQNYQFNYALYNKKVNPNKTEGFTIICIVIILLMGLAFFVTKNANFNTNYYFVQVNQFLKYSDASALAGEIQAKGGAGYVYYDGYYHVFTSFYPSKEDANSVCNNLSSSYPNAKVFNIEAKKIKYSNRFTKQERDFVLKVENANKSLIEGLYTAINRYDTSTDNVNKLSLNLTNLAENYLKETANINSYFVDTAHQTCKQNILDIQDCANGLKDKLKDDNFACTFKYDLIKIVILHCSFVNGL